MTTVQRPNILWITTHDINPDLSCYTGIWPGAEYAQTPNLDQLAADGTRYDNAFATTPVCAPSRSAILTGMYPTAIGTMHMRSKAVPPEGVRCFPEYLREAGYYCTNNAFSDFQFQVPVTVWDDHSSQAHWRNRPDPSQPFFAVFHGMLTHESQIYAADDQYQRNTSRLNPEQRHDPATAPLPPYYPDTPVFRQAWAHYSDNITAMDYQVGDLLQQLADDGLAETTLVVFWSDHGLGMPRAKRWPYDSGLHVPLIIRWPGHIVPGTTHSQLVPLMDLSATMLVVAGVPVPANMHAQPLFNAQGQPIAEQRQLIFGHRDRMDEQEDTIRTVRDAHFRYIRNYHPDRSGMQHHEYADRMATWQEFRRLSFEEATMRGRGEVANLLTPVQRQVIASSKPVEELYDLRADPYEIENLADDPRYAADLERLRNALSEWQQSYGDLGLMPEAQLLEQWRPGGIPQLTEAPIIQIIDGQLIASCATASASIGWTSDPPGSATISEFSRISGDPDTGGRSWQLYSQPIAALPGITLWFRAQRLGFQASDDVIITVGS